MIEAYAIGVSARLEDDISPGLLRIIDSLTRANTAMLEFSANARNISRLGLTIGKNLDKAAAGATALGDASAALTRASYVLDYMAVSSADIARNLKVARAEGAGMGAGITGGGSGGGVESGTSGSGARRARLAAEVGAGVALGGAYGNAQLLDINLVSAGTLQTSPDQWLGEAEKMRVRELAWAQKYAFATHGEILPFAHANLEGARQLRTLNADQRLQMMDTVMPYAAMESKFKDVGLSEAVQAFIGLAHQAQAYSPEKATPLFETFVQASLSTHADLVKLSSAASYALPSAVAAGANPSDVINTVAVMMQAGITNTKAGTWINAMVQNALPNTLGSGLFRNKLQNQALQELGLYKGGKSQFYKDGHLDIMKEISLLADARDRMTPEHFIATTRLGFGVQGQRAAALFSEEAVLQNLSVLRDLGKNAQSPVDINKLLNQLSTVAKADQAIANAKMTIMNATVSLGGPLNSIFDSFNKQAKNILPNGEEFGVSYGVQNATQGHSATQGHPGNIATGKINYHNHVVVQIDGQDVRHQILHNMPATPAHSASGLNQQHSPLRPGLNAAHGL
jgi:hypothetical protein